MRVRRLISNAAPSFARLLSRVFPNFFILREDSGYVLREDGGRFRREDE